MKQCNYVIGRNAIGWYICNRKEETWFNKQGDWQGAVNDERIKKNWKENIHWASAAKLICAFKRKFTDPLEVGEVYSS